MDVQKVLIDVNGCVCPDREPYNKAKNMTKGVRAGGNVYTEAEWKAVQKAEKDAGTAARKEAAAAEKATKANAESK
jgi:hypothetical protein